MVRDRREAGNQILGFATRPFVLCGLPIRRPPQSDLVYERRNGSNSIANSLPFWLRWNVIAWGTIASKSDLVWMHVKKGIS